MLRLQRVCSKCGKVFETREVDTLAEVAALPDTAGEWAQFVCSDCTCAECRRPTDEVCACCQQPKCSECWSDDEGEDWCQKCKTEFYEEQERDERLRDAEEGM